MANTTTTPVETSTNIEVQVAKHDVSFNLHRLAPEGLGLSIDFALSDAFYCKDPGKTQMIILARPLYQYEDGLHADEWADEVFSAELSIDEARQLRAFLNHPATSAILDGPRMVYGSDDEPSTWIHAKYLLSR